MKSLHLAAITLLACCGARTGLELAAGSSDADAPVEPDAADAHIEADASDAASEEAAPDAGFDAPPPLCSTVDAGSGPLGCSASLVAEAITASSPGCYVDVQVTTGEMGTVAYACDGGAALVTFGTNELPGVVVDGQLQVCFGTTFPFSDGCLWQSAQNIVGSLSSGMLAYSYVEEPAPGQMNCASPCTAKGTIVVK